MARKIIGFAALAVSVLALGLLVQSQSGPVQQYPGVPHWPPRPSEIVNLDSVNLTSGPVTLPPGGTLVIYSVPADQWLVLTGVSGPGQGTTINLCEDFGGALTVKANSNLLYPTSVVPQNAQGPLGWVFRPGSNVVMHNISGTASFVATPFSMLGYLAR